MLFDNCQQKTSILIFNLIQLQKLYRCFAKQLIYLKSLAILHTIFTNLLLKN